MGQEKAYDIYIVPSERTPIREESSRSSCTRIRKNGCFRFFILFWCYWFSSSSPRRLRLVQTQRQPVKKINGTRCSGTSCIFWPPYHHHLLDHRWTALLTNVSLDNKSKKLVKVAGGGAWNATALCSKSSKFAIRLLSVTNGGIMIGLAPKTFQKDSQILNSCGWYYNIYDGTCYSQSGDSRRSFTSISPNRAVGTIIGIDWNQSTGAVSIFCNGQNMGVA